MPFPFSIRGSFSIPRIDKIDDVSLHLLEQAEALLSVHSDSVRVVEQTVFSRPRIGAWFFSYGGSWHPMVPFDNITLTISGTSSVACVGYILSTRRMLWIVLCMIAVVIIFGAASFQQETFVDTVAGQIKFAAVMFFWLFGMNYLLGMVRGPKWLQNELLKRL
jgi:hypothetical protein